ncbi:MAG: hypothetical protein KDA83_09110 [Planctomycetales bacterium]|nr:hypothetical protein [Planctomycetales bacterium]
MNQELDNSDKLRVAEAINLRWSELDDIEMTLAIESAGVAQAVDKLRKALDKVESCLNNRQYEAVANLGYEDVSSEFIFLQRTMGGLLTAAHDRQRFISDIAGDIKLTYEIVEPLVEAEARSRDVR